MNNSHGVFLDLSSHYSDPATSRYAVLPILYEKTVSYKTGTAAGPIAIIEASAHMELYDEELGEEFHCAGIATYPIIQPAAGPEEEIRRILEAAVPILKDGKFLLSLGGEHSITGSLVRSVADACGDISVLQIDAHADLRNSYEGSEHSHASVMRRVLEVTDRICQVGIRSVSMEEVQQCPKQAENFITATQVHSDEGWVDRVLDLLGPTVYVTVDIDAFDPSVAPGTGTPEPGGMTWQQVTRLLRRVCTERNVVAADIVEVRPISPNHITEVLAARLAYKIIAYTQLS